MPPPLRFVLVGILIFFRRNLKDPHKNPLRDRHSRPPPSIGTEGISAIEPGYFAMKR